MIFVFGLSFSVGVFFGACVGTVDIWLGFSFEEFFTFKFEFVGGVVS